MYIIIIIIIIITKVAARTLRILLVSGHIERTFDRGGVDVREGGQDGTFARERDSSIIF